jgi:hypothetical protein
VKSGKGRRKKEKDGLLEEGSIYWRAIKSFSQTRPAAFEKRVQKSKKLEE